MIRWVRDDDLQVMMDFAHRTFEESPVYGEFSLNHMYVMNLLKVTAGFHDDYFGVVCEKDGVVVGVMTGSLGQIPFCNEVVAFDSLVYVLPEHRSGMVFGRLHFAFQTWADEMKAVKQIVGVSSGVNVEAMSRNYERLGYTPSGITLSKTTHCHEELNIEYF